MKRLWLGGMLAMGMLMMVGCGGADMPVLGGDGRIVPGERVGVVVLGMVRDSVHQRLGPPAEVLPPPPGTDIRRDVWPDGPGHHVTLYYHADTLAQIAFTSPAYATAEGLSTYSTFDALRQPFSPIQTIINPYDAVTTYYDAAAHGFAFGTAPANPDQHANPEGEHIALFIHTLDVDMLIF